MKQLLQILFLFLTTYGFSQQSLPVIKAASKAATIHEEGQLKRKWNVSPEIKIDAFTTNKLIRPTAIKFKTDIDSIGFILKPGQYKDFIVLLNGKDSCYTRIESPAIKDFRKLKPEIHDTIPLFINSQNTISVKAVLNKIDTLNLNFDSGGTELVLIEETLNNKVKSKLKLYNTPYEVAIGSRVYKTKVYDTKVTGNGTDGLIGWDLFDGMIVELNYDKNIMVIHSRLPKALKRDKAAVKLNMKYFNYRFFTAAQIAHRGTKVNDWFLFDTGYQRTVMLDNDLLREQKFPADQMEVIKKVIMRGTKNNEIPVITSNLESLKIGKHELKNVPAQIMTTSKTMFDANIHILGNEVLKRFNAFMDFQENVVYLQPSHLFNADYIEKT